MNNKRYSGILLHPTSLPSDFGIGTLGKNAFRWIDILEKSEQKWWQILPLGHTGFGDSPYQCFSSFAGNPLLIDFELLVDDGWLTKHEIESCRVKEQTSHIDFAAVINAKYPLLKRAYFRFLKLKPCEKKLDFSDFCNKNSYWLDDYALFMEIKSHNQHHPWHQWDDHFKKRDAETLTLFKKQFHTEINFHCFCQWLFFCQWKTLKNYANAKNIEIIGDIPLYVAYDSADAWAMPQLFQFDKSLNPKVVAGVPPDYFSNTGQLWGNPIYNWKKMKKERFQWWIQRVEASLELFDWIRIDHFRGFSAYWAVPFGNPTAATGKWIPASGKELFKALKKHFGDLKIIAEDLGEITPDVLELRDAFNFPGMKILQYAFFSDDNENMPHNFTQNCVVYTGTHDNETTAGWYLNQDEKTKERIHTYLQSDGTDIHWKLIRLAWSSAANIAIVPMQDLLGLDNSARMNVPGTVGNKNWQWQLLPQQLNEETFRILRFLTVLFGRNLSKQ